MLVKGTTLGVVTDVSGKYRLTLPKEQKDISLIFSFVGMKTQVIKLGEQDTLNVVLEEDIADLDEVVVRAYGTQNKREMISAISSAESRGYERASSGKYCQYVARTFGRSEYHSTVWGSGKCIRDRCPWI